jgi:hypothetical protein
MIDVFISYSHEDIAVAERIDNYLSSHRSGYYGTTQEISVWRDTRLTPGVKFEGEIQENLEAARLCLFLMSQASLDSEYCQNEVGFAEANETPIVPVRLDVCQPKGFLATRSYIDFSSGFEDHRNESTPSLFDLYWTLREQLIELRQDDIRPSLVEFYERLSAHHRQTREYESSFVTAEPVVDDNGITHANDGHFVPKQYSLDFDESS